MASEIWVRTSKLQAADKNAIEEMIRTYHDAYKSDKTIQLKYILAALIKSLGETITLRSAQPEFEFIIARTESSNKLVGWISLAFKFEKHQQLSEEHVLFTQYVLIPDIAAKAKNAGIDTAEMKIIAHKVLRDFKSARERELPDKHCILSTLVVDPEYQNKGVASALLSTAIARSEVFSFPIWVPALAAHQTLFEKQLFEEVGEYDLDLNEHVPKRDDNGKNTTGSNLAKYHWKFMLRREPLEKALKAYKSSKVHAEAKEEEDRKVNERGLNQRKEKNPTSKEASPRTEAVSPPADLLIGGDVQTARSTEDMIARDDPEEEETGPSLPLLKKSTSKPKGEPKDQATKNAAKEVENS